MQNFFNLAICVVGKAKRTNRDPVDIGAKLVRKLKLGSIDGETLFMEIWLVQRYNLADDETLATVGPELRERLEYKLLETV